MDNIYTKLDTLSQEEKNEMLQKLVASLFLFPFEDDIEKIYQWHYETVNNCGLFSYNNLARMVQDAQTASRFKKNITQIWPDICGKEELVLKCGDKEYSANWLLSLGFLLSEEDITNV